MAHEEDTLAALEQGHQESVACEEARQARYKVEDASRVALREQEDRLRDEGDAAREQRKAELEAAIAARGDTPEAQIADQNVRISELEARLAAMTQTGTTDVTGFAKVDAAAQEHEPVAANEGTHAV